MISIMLSACGEDADQIPPAVTPPAVTPPAVTTIPATPIGPSTPIKPPVTTIPATPIGPSTPVKPPVIIFPIPKPEIVPPSVILPAPEQRELLQNLRFLDGATELKKAQFALENWSPRAIAARDGILYIANDSGKSNILRYDLNTKNVLAPIQPENIRGIGQSWNRLSDISIYKDRLYASSLSSNRVDIFDVATGEAQFVMSLGINNWSGDQNLVTVHPLSVAANDQYVFVADTLNRINVWKQSDVVPSNSLKAKKHARLSLPNCGDIYCDMRLEAVDNLLYASFDNGQVYVYDVSTIQQGATENDIVPLKRTNPGINIFNTADDGLFYGSRNSGHVESFKPEELRGAVNFLPKAQDSFRAYRLEDSSTYANLSKAKDMVVNQQKVLQLSGGKVMILPIQTVQQYQSNQTGYVTQLQQAAALSQNYILQDGEDWDTLTNPNLRYFKVNNILSATVERDNIQLQSYSAAAVSNLDIQAKLKGTDQWFTIAHLDQLQPFSQTKLNMDTTDQHRYPLVDGKGSIQLAGLNQFKQLPVDLLDIKVVSKTDPLVQKLATIKSKWGISFGKYSQADGQWQKINPVYAREWVIMMTNFAYMLNSPEFEHIWFNQKKIMGSDFFGNAGPIVGNDGYFTPQQYTQYFNQIMNRGDIRLGITTIGGGLGGGDILGNDTWLFYAHYFNTDVGLIGHEFGHHWGSHDSSWAGYDFGIQPITGQLHQYLQRKQRLPYMDPELNKFHKAPKDQLYNGIVESFRKPRPATDVNNLERYFAKNPL